MRLNHVCNLIPIEYWIAVCSLEYSAAGVPFNLLGCLTEESSQVLNKKLERNLDMRKKFFSFKSDVVLNAGKKVFNFLCL